MRPSPSRPPRSPRGSSRPYTPRSSRGPRGVPSPSTSNGGCAMALPAILALCTRRLVTGRWPA